MPRHLTDYDLAVIRRRQGEDIPLPPKPRRSPRHEESKIQQAVIRWWAITHKSLGVPHEFLLYAVPNDHRGRDEATASILKREGLRSGVPDLVLAFPVAPYHGMYLELKTATGRPSDSQNDFIAAVGKAGYRAGVAYGYDEAVGFISGYLSSK